MEKGGRGSRIAALGILVVFMTAFAPSLVRAGEHERTYGDPGSAPVPIVVELFTSQGCEACPEMDELVGKLAQEPNVLVLTFHVDYWDYIGWKDPFGHPAHSERQRRYGQRFGLKMVHTPQVIIDGEIESQAMELETLLRQVQLARDHGPRRVPVGIRYTLEGDLAVTIAGDPQPAPVNVWFVVYDEVRGTPVRAGENMGKFLKSYNVVRQWKRLDTWSGGTLDLRIGNDSIVSHRPGGCAILLQREEMGPFLGVARLEWD